MTPRDTLGRFLPGPEHSNARKTHCIAGHPFTDRNTRRRRQSNGVLRVCRACERERRRRQRANVDYLVNEKRRRWARENAA